MIGKYFNFLQISDEYGVFEVVLDHTKTDEQELVILRKMIDSSTKEHIKDIEELYENIRNISNESHKQFETLSDQIIHSNFDHQKQYDILRIHSRIEDISQFIIATAKRLYISYKIGCTLPIHIQKNMQEMVQLVQNMHRSFINVVQYYIEDNKDVIEAIHKVQDEENYIDHIRSEYLTNLYKMANEKSLAMGDFMIIREIIEHLEGISDAIESASSSFNWLLLK